MEFEGLLYAFKIAKYKTIKETSIKLGISQPSIINKIKMLEMNLGFDVFIKTNKGMILTGDGKEFIEGIETLINSYDLFINKYTKVNKATFTLASNYVTLAQKYFYNILNKIIIDNSDLKIDSNELKYINLSPLEIINSLVNKEISIGIMCISKEAYLLLEAKILNSDLEVQIVKRSNAVIYLKDNSSLVYNKAIDEVGSYNNPKEIAIKEVGRYNNPKEIAIKEVGSYNNPKGISIKAFESHSNIKEISISDLKNYNNIVVKMQHLNSYSSMKNIFVNSISEMLITLDCDENSFYIGENIHKEFLDDNNIKTFEVKNGEVEFYNLLIYNKNINKREVGLIEIIIKTYTSMLSGEI